VNNKEAYSAYMDATNTPGSNKAGSYKKALDISGAKNWMIEDCELLGHTPGSGSFDECLTEIIESEQ
jgi:hypothetical protein